MSTVLDRLSTKFNLMVNTTKKKFFIVPIRRVEPTINLGMTDDQMDVVNAHLEDGNKVNAIKSVREFTGLGLREGKVFVDGIRPNYYES